MNPHIPVPSTLDHRPSNTARCAAFTLIELPACHPKLWRRKAQSAFTLIELLVVIAIIGILAGLLLPALGGAREAAKKAKAATLANSIGLAARAYYNEYGFWPNRSSPYTVDQSTPLSAAEGLSLLWMLTGVDTYIADATIVAGGNPKKIVFLDVKAADLGIVDTSYFKASSGSTNIVNSWGNSIRVKFDYDGDNTVSGSGLPGSASVSGGYAIWSVGGRNNSITNMSWK